MNDALEAMAGAIAICALILSHATWRLRNGNFLLIDPLNIFWAGAIVCYVVQPIAYFDQIQEFQPTASIPRALAWIFVGLVAVVAGFESTLGPKLGRIVPVGPKRLSKTRLRALGVLLLGLGLLGYGYEISTAGGLGAWIAVPRGGTDWEAASSYVTLLTGMLPVGVAILLFASELEGGSKLARALAWGCAVLMLVWFFYLGTRSRSILWIVTMLAAYYLPKRKNPSLILIAALFPVVFVGVTFLAENRTSFTNLSINLSSSETAERLQRALKNSIGFDEEGYKAEIQAGTEFNYALTAIEMVPDQVSFTYGYNFLEFLTRPIPRAVWENKRYPAAEAFTPLLEAGGLSSTWVPVSVEPVLMGPAPTFAGFWWAVGGPLALLVGGVMTGMLLRAVRSVYDRQKGKCEGDIIIYWSLLGIGFIEAVATPLSWVFSLPFVVVPILIGLRLVAVRRLRST